MGGAGSCFDKLLGKIHNSPKQMMTPKIQLPLLGKGRQNLGIHKAYN